MGLETQFDYMNQVIWVLTLNGWVMLLTAAPIFFLMFRALEIQEENPDYGTSKYWAKKNKEKRMKKKKKKSLKHNKKKV